MTPWAPSGQDATRARRGTDRLWDTVLVLVVVLTGISLTAHGLPIVEALATRSPAPAARARPATSPAPPSTPTDAPTGGALAPTPGDASAAPSPSGPVALPTSPPPVPAYDRVCLRRDNPATGAHLPPGDPFGDDLAHLGDRAELQRLYAVRQGALVPLDGLGEPRRCDEQLLALIGSTAPTLMPHLEQLLVFDKSTRRVAGEWVVGGEATPKRIGPGRYDDDRWRLSIAPNGLDRETLAWVIAHELAHLASLNHDQMLAGVDRSTCATLYIGTGCLLHDSLLHRYLVNTWPETLFDAWAEADKHASAEARRAAYEKLYRAHRDEFVTEYAAFHPVEDFAESFAMWCTREPGDRERARLLAAGSSDSGTKVEWFSSARRDVVPQLGPGCQMLREFAR